MRILIDTNVILDILLKREPFFDSSYRALKQALINNTECFVSATAVTDIYYLLRKGLGNIGEAKDSMEHLLQLVSIVDVGAMDIQTALSDSMPDFEDAVVHAVAVRNKVDYILTRNMKGFEGAEIPAITPQEFMKIT